MVQTISLAIIALIMLLVGVFTIPLLLRATRAASQAEKLMESAREHIIPLSHDAAIILNDVKKIVKSAEDQMEKASDSMDAMRETTLRIRDFEERLEEQIERPLLEVAALISAFSKAGRVFWQRIVRG